MKISTYIHSYELCFKNIVNAKAHPFIQIKIQIVVKRIILIRSKYVMKIIK